LEGAQFAWPAAIDRLREAARGQAPRVDTLCAVDPANAWGSALPWPALRDGDARPARRVGASVVLVDGALALWVEPRGKRIATAADLPTETIELAIRVGLPLLAAGARVDYRGLVVRATTLVAPQPEPEPEPDDDDA